MTPFLYHRAASHEEAVGRFYEARAAGLLPAYVGGGTSLVDLMKVGVTSPDVVIDVSGLATNQSALIKAGPRGLYLGANVRMADAAADPAIARNYPALAQSLRLAASQQIRNMARLGGNVLQATRCPYFRDPSWTSCNKRKPGSGCAARSGIDRHLAVLGDTKECMAAYPGDFAVALLALDAEVSVRGPRRSYKIPATRMFSSSIAAGQETAIELGELITGFFIPFGRHCLRSAFCKVRDRRSFAFALASAAVALELEDGVIRGVRIALGGLATRPWRAAETERLLSGRVFRKDLIEQASAHAFAAARPSAGNAFKVELGRAVLVTALMGAGERQL